MSASATPSRSVPFFGLARQYQRYRTEFLAITDRVLSSGQVLQGPDVANFERSLAAACGRKHGVALSSCTDALAFALLACGVGPGDEVLVTGLSFIASASPILRVGARPRFVDIDPDYFLMDPAAAERLVTSRTKAIVAVHLYGQTLPMAAWEEFARKHGLSLIEDAAQALGARDGQRAAGGMGRVSCISFDPTKVIASFSSAGGLVTDDPEILRKAQMLRYHGRDPATRSFDQLGYNSQLATEMAGMLDFKLSKLAEWQQARTAVAEIYLKALAGIPGVTLPRIRPGSTHNWHKFVLRVKNRDALAAALKDRGIQTMVHYARALPDEPLMQALGLPEAATAVPTARRLISEVVSLPVYPEMSFEEASYVAAEVHNFYAHE